MKRFSVVVNDCAAPSVPGIQYVRSRETEHGDRNFSMSFDALATGLPRLFEPTELDWLETLAHLFAADLACERGRGDTEWSRSIDLWLPVRSPDFWVEHRSTIEGVWVDLTGDALRLHFELANDAPAPPRMGTTPFREHDGVALVSGGQDSFVGTAALLSEGTTPLLLSHSASGATNSAQSAVQAALRKFDGGLARLKLSARRSSRSSFGTFEASQRSRTLLYLGAAAAVAAVGGSDHVWISENGVMAIHLPLTEARIGSLSTHTAAPSIIERISRLSTQILGSDINIVNPLIGKTKPEVVRLGVDLGLGDQFAKTVSCWKIGRSRTHCGVCAPCLLRRISCETNAVADVNYASDIFDDTKSLDDPVARDNLSHFMALTRDLLTIDDVAFPIEYPELLNGAPALSLAESIALHRRWGEQADAVLSAHTVPRSIQ
jgi:7-cyano-7-deazaguanine synthase in queuosine biosynthesis